jgi:hypothetical protein
VNRRRYKLRRFKVVGGKPIGAKTFGPLDLSSACRMLLHWHSPWSRVRVLGPGRYSVADGAAELEVVS